jgi:molecular chaperone Hsp33
VAEMLGEMAAAGALMQANIKFNGALILQIFGEGPGEGRRWPRCSRT